MNLEVIRSHKILGVAVFDTLTSYLTFSALGSQIFGLNAVFAGLMSIPVSIVSHVVAGVDTPLTKYVMSGSPHLLHAPAIGLTLGIGAKLAGASNINSINTGLAVSTFALLYMREYSHGLPKPVKKYLRKKLLKSYMMYRRLFSKE